MPRRRRLAPTLACLLFLAAVFPLRDWAAAAQPQGAGGHPRIDFNRDIRPIFSEHCYACHGPDEQKRKAGLRLDLPDAPFKELKSGNYAVVPGDPAKSALVQRVSSDDPDEVMPPPKYKKPLKPEQISNLKAWVLEGAKWKKHWSFIPPERPPLPVVKDRRWPRNPIDYFTLARLEKEKLQPNPNGSPPGSSVTT